MNAAKDMQIGIIDFEQTAREIAACQKDLTLMLEIKPNNHPKYKDMTAKEYYGKAVKSIERFALMVKNHTIKCAEASTKGAPSAERTL